MIRDHRIIPLTPSTDDRLDCSPEDLFFLNSHRTAEIRMLKASSRHGVADVEPRSVSTRHAPIGCHGFLSSQMPSLSIT
jgi:hypothetical protein